MCADTNTDIKGVNIEAFVESVISQVYRGVTNASKNMKKPFYAKADGSIIIELSTVLDTKKGGGLNIQVIDLGVKVSEYQTHKITIPVRIVNKDNAMVGDL